jgi:undecaprenyl-diphosphatase
MGLIAIILVLAVLQGLTEYLPVSSSGHLVLAKAFLPGGEQLAADSSTEVLLHVGTLLSVLVFYRQRIVRVAKGFFGFGAEVAPSRRLVWHLLIASIPAGVVGVGFEEQLDHLFAEPLPAAVCLLITGSMLWYARRLRVDGAALESLSWKGALLIGAVQAFAILPGISRSGMTIVTGLRLGLSAVDAAAFSFLMSIPAILGAVLVKFGELESDTALGTAEIGLAVGTSFLVGLGALGLLVWLTRQRKLHVFAPYCWLLGATALVAVALT